MPRMEMAKTPGRASCEAKERKGVLVSPRPWKRRRMAVVDSGGEGWWREIWREGGREEKSSCCGILVGGMVISVCFCRDGFLELSWWLIAF